MLYRVSLVLHEGSAQILSSSWVLGVLPDFSGMRPTIVGVSCVKSCSFTGTPSLPVCRQNETQDQPILSLFRRCGAWVRILDMTQNQDETSHRLRSPVEKAALVAVGAPTAALKALNARVSDLRDTMKASRKELSGDLAAEIDEWIAEGERVIERAAERLRGSEWAEEIKESARTTREAARSGMDKAAAVARSGLGAMAADEKVTVIKGIGPGYAERLQTEGIFGVRRFLDRTETQRDLEDLARSTGIAADTLASWRRKADLGRVPGIGESYQDLLHRAGIWTIDQLVEIPASDLVSEMEAMDPDQAPTQDRVSRWKSEAARLVD